MARNRKRRSQVLADSVLSKPVDESTRRNVPDDIKKGHDETANLDCDDEVARCKHIQIASRRHQTRDKTPKPSPTTSSARRSDCHERIRKRLKLARFERREYEDL